MAYTLKTTSRYLNSEELPQICMFSGKTEGLVERRFEISKFNPWHIVAAVMCGLIGLIVLVFALKKNATVTIPQVPSEVSKRNWRRYGWFIPLYCLLPAVWCLAQVAAEIGGDAGVVAIVILSLLGLVGVGLAIAGTIVWPKNEVTFKVGANEGDIIITFPERLQEVYIEYKAAYDEWLAKRGKPRSRSQEQDAKELDDWTDDVGANWDEGKKAK